MSRAYTREEVQEMLIRQVKGIVSTWSNMKAVSEKEKLEGVAFSILSMIDGCVGYFPAINLCLSPHHSDKQFHIEEGENWFEDGMVVNDNIMLHDAFLKD